MQLKHMRYTSYEDRGEGYQDYNMPEPGENHNVAGNFISDSLGDFLEFPYSAWGDYIGDSVNRANYNYLKDNYWENSGFYFVSGGYSYHAVFIHKDVLKNHKIRNQIKNLEDYPLLSDEYISALEMELESASWDSWVKFDLSHALEEAGIEYDNLTLYDDYQYVMRNNNIDGHCEDAVSWHVDIARIVENWKFRECPSCGIRLNNWDVCETCPQLFQI